MNQSRVNHAKPVLLRLASDQCDNGIINAEAELLKIAQAKSREIERLVQEHGEAPVHYDWLFPELEATFIAETSQDGRQANLLSFPDVVVADLFPLPKLKDYCLIDCKTAAWILGRYFKLQTFLDLLDKDVVINPDLVLLAPFSHRLIYLGFVLAPRYAHRRAFLQSPICNIMVTAQDTLNWIEPTALQEEPGFAELLQDFVQHGRCDGATAHRDLSAWVDAHWGVHCRPFTFLSDPLQLASKAT